MLVDDQAFDERDRHQPLSGTHGYDFVQRGRRIDDCVPGPPLKATVWLPTETASSPPSYDAGSARNTVQEISERSRPPNQREHRRIGVRTVFHTGLVAAQQRSRDSLRHREVDELARTQQGGLHDLRGLGRLRVGRVGLQVVLRLVGRVRHTPVDEA
ncbi:MAG: hypothetical protein IPJ97_11680 [Proteobacteria bacterium]|nr:hypothetical protein [Pseudomonadota bacterium]